MARFSPKLGPPHVADGGEATHQRGRGLGPRQEIGVAKVAGNGLHGIWTHQHGMPVHIDQAGHQRATGPCNPRDALGSYWRFRNGLDDVAFDEHVGRRGKDGALSVEDADILEEHIIGDRRSAKCYSKNCCTELSAE